MYANRFTKKPADNNLPIPSQPYGAFYLTGKYPEARKLSEDFLLLLTLADRLLTNQSAKF